MTATIDLLLLGLESERIGKPHNGNYYEPKWCILGFTDTHGIWGSGPGGSNTVRPESTKGQFLDILFGDGPKRHGLKTYRPTTIIGRGNESRRDPNKWYFVRETQILQALKKVGVKTRTALRLEEFLEIMSAVPRGTDFWVPDNVVPPMFGFLENLPTESLLVLPLIGVGLRHELPELFHNIDITPAIIRLAY